MVFDFLEFDGILLYNKYWQLVKKIKLRPIQSGSLSYYQTEDDLMDRDIYWDFKYYQTPPSYLQLVLAYLAP